MILEKNVGNLEIRERKNLCFFWVFVGEKSWSQGKKNCMVNERGVEREYLWTFVFTQEWEYLFLCLGGLDLRGPRQK